MKIKNHKLFLLLFLIILISCSENDDDNSVKNIVFLEQHKEISGALLSGPEPPII